MTTRVLTTRTSFEVLQESAITGAHLLPLIDHPNTAIVARVMYALGNIRDPRAAPKLIEKLYDNRQAYYLSYTVFDWAAMALRNIGTPDCIEAVNEAFRKRNKLDMQE